MITEKSIADELREVVADNAALREALQKIMDRTEGFGPVRKDLIRPLAIEALATRKAGE